MAILAKQLQLVQQTFTSFVQQNGHFFVCVLVYSIESYNSKKSLMKQQKKQPVSYILSKRAHIEKREEKKKNTPNKLKKAIFC